MQAGLFRCSISYVLRMIIPSGLSDAVLFHVDAAMRIINRRVEILMQETFELGVREGLIMLAATSDPPLSQGCMADILGVNRNVMVLEIDRLEKRGLVKRERLPANRREQIITLTPKGKRTLAAIEKLRAQIRPRTWKSAQERANLISWGRSVIEAEDPQEPARKKR